MFEKKKITIISYTFSHKKYTQKGTDIFSFKNINQKETFKHTSQLKNMKKNITLNISILSFSLWRTASYGMKDVQNKVAHIKKNYVPA